MGHSAENVAMKARTSKTIAPGKATTPGKTGGAAAARTAKAAPARALPPALAKNAKAVHDAAVRRHRAEGLEAIALIQTRRRDMASNFLDVADALRVLRTDDVFRALGRGSFAEVCERDLDMSLTKANQLLALTERVDAPLLIAVGQERAAALLDLADATPEDDTPANLQNARVKLPSGETLRVAKASTREIREAAVAIRRARGDRTKGRTTTAAEEELLAMLEAQLRATPALEKAEIALVAMGAKRGADVKIRVPLAQLGALTKVLAKALPKTR